MSDRSESPPPPDWSPPASDADAREVRQSLDSFVPPPPPARDALRYSQDSYAPPPPRQSADSFARQSTDSFAPPPPPPPRQSQEPAPPPWEDDDDDAAPRAWHGTDEDAAPRAPDDIGDDFAAADAWAREERVAAEEAKAFAALAADGPPPWADDDPDETTLWQHAKASKPAWADDEEEGETTALDDLDAAPVKVRRSSEQLERFSRLRKSRSPKKKAPQIVDDGPPPQSALVAKLFGKRPAPKKPEVIKPVPLSMEDRQALEGELSRTEAELAEARAACRKLRADVDAAQRRATEALAERTSVRSQRQKELDEWIARERDVCKRESLALHRDRRSRRDERVNLDRQKKKEVERLKEEAAALRDQLEARARRDRLTERRLSDRNAQAEAKARELATQLSLLETQNAEAAAKRARRAAARAADRDAFGLRAAEVAAAKADAEETMRTRSSLNEETAASSQPSETFLDQPTTFFEAETRLEASYDAGRYASTPPDEEDDASDDGGDALSASAADPRRSQDSFALRRSQDSVARSQDSFVAPPAPIQQSQTEPAWRPAGRDGKLERAWADGTREVKYRNGTTKRCSAHGEVVVSFQNGDTKTTSPEGTVVYFYAAADTTHTTDELNGIETFEFPNGQYERHFASGEKEIRFPDGTVKLVRADGGTETTFADGQVVVEEPPE